MSEEKGLKLVGIDDNGNARPVSLIDDGDGKFVIRTVDAAPWAYDELKEAIRVSDEEAQTKIEALASAVENNIGNRTVLDYVELTNRATTWHGSFFQPPLNAKGMIVQMHINNASHSGDGSIKLRLNQYNLIDRSTPPYRVETESMSGPQIVRPQTLMVLPGITALESTLSPTKMVSLPIFGEYRIDTLISGDFSDPEHTGFDFEIKIEWIY